MKLINPDLPWFVARTAPRMEDRAEDNLRSAGFDAYVPMMRREFKHKRTNVITEKTQVLDGFQSYIFVAVPLFDFYNVVQCVGVERLLGVRGTPERIHGASVAEIQALEMDGRFDIRSQAPLKAGDRVRIKNEKHSLAGQTVTIDRTGSKTVRAMMNLLGGMVPVELKLSDVEKAA